MKLLASDAEGAPSEAIFVHGQIDESRKYLKGVQDNEVAPAVVVTNTAGEVTQWWSWKSLFADGAQLKEAISDVDRNRKESSSGEQYDPGLTPISLKQHGISSASEDDKTWIVNVRPSADDLLPAILADRPFTIKEMISIAEVKRQHLESLKKSAK
eukprot:gnl/TRDRNA2_/TRDRNA2_33046_c0_seq1.p1 gnl/TRDRNA2_/TRDRNA2_33046_c0~~gnl/TRDRNA2_/TRDRNA2_33046_c0_seq1.p1  ORF type:complete len:156 (+),score=33.27 gnl/TRDRNA2_/TRDRNA2_33046_c0_seq1:265-732(+)